MSWGNILVLTHKYFLESGMHNTITGVDLAKEEIQVCVTKRNKVQSNVDMTPEQFTS